MIVRRRDVVKRVGEQYAMRLVASTAGLAGYLRIRYLLGLESKACLQSSEQK